MCLALGVAQRDASSMPQSSDAIVEGKSLPLVEATPQRELQQAFDVGPSSLLNADARVDECFLEAAKFADVDDSRRCGVGIDDSDISILKIL